MMARVGSSEVLIYKLRQAAGYNRVNEAGERSITSANKHETLTKIYHKPRSAIQQFCQAGLLFGVTDRLFSLS
jgi:hypothetical protein